MYQPFCTDPATIVVGMIIATAIGSFVGYHLRGWHDKHKWN